MKVWLLLVSFAQEPTDIPIMTAVVPPSERYNTQIECNKFGDETTAHLLSKYPNARVWFSCEPLDSKQITKLFPSA